MDDNYTKELITLIEAKDLAYTERNKLVAVLSKIFYSTIEKHEGDDSWDKEWCNVVFIKLPTGQVSWHIHDKELPLFDHIPMHRRYQRLMVYDGHSTDEKYERLSKLSTGYYTPLKIYHR